MALSSSKPNSAGATAASSQVPNLGTILRHFIGLDLTIELKNGRIYRGQLQEADDYMNLVIRKIENENEHSHQMQRQNMHQDRQQNDNHHDNDIDFLMIHIRGPSIRYIHFPANADLPRLVKLGLDRVKTAKDKYERGKRKERSWSPTTWMRTKSRMITSTNANVCECEYDVHIDKTEELKDISSWN